MAESIHKKIAAKYAQYRRARNLDVPFQPGDGGYASPIEFSELVLEPEFYQLEVYLGSTGWNHRIVGLVQRGLIAITGRESKIGHYIYHVAVVPWSEVREVRFWRKKSYFGYVLGVLVILLGLVMLGAMLFILFDGFEWSFKFLRAITGMTVMGLGGFGFGIAIMLLSHRIRIDVSLKSGSVFLVVPRFQFENTQWFLTLIQDYCWQFGIPVTSTLGGPNFESLTQADGSNCPLNK